MPRVTCSECPIEFNIAPSHLKRLTRPPTCSAACRAKSMTGEKHWNWRGGRYVDSEGYVRVWVDGEYVFEHRKVMEDALGRKLRPDEVVHHRDEDRQNNAPENLRLVADRGTHTMEEHVVRDRAGKLRPRPGPATRGAQQRRQQRAFARLVRAAPRRS